MIFIYVLKLEHGKYYVGKSLNPSVRIDDHNANNGSVWTKKYKPIEIIEVIENCDDFDEDKQTLIYMKKYGINNVRGGSFCQIVLSENNIQTLKQMITGASDKCYICGKIDHFANQCKSNNNDEKTDGLCDCPTSWVKSHRKSKCLLKAISKMFDNEDDNIEKLKQDNNTNTPQVYKKNIKCYRCDRFGHLNVDCYAKTKLDGTLIEKEKKPTKKSRI